MKILHLADLHLGKLVLEHSMIEDQRYILDRIIEKVSEYKVDCVLICGDIYDRGIPSVEAVNLFSIFLTNLYKLKVKVFVISGNHDSKDRLSFGNELFTLNGVFIEGVFNGELKCVSIDDEYGKINIYMLPFIKPIDVRKYFDKDIDSYNNAVSCIIENTKINKEERNIIMVHQFVIGTGVELIESDEEVISLGGIDNIDVELFDDFDYVALGHLHGPQKVGREEVRYAGSPLKYSFSEVNQKKSLCIIDVKEKGNIHIELVPLEPMRDMRIIRGPIDKLLDYEVYSSGNVDDYIEALVLDDDYVVDAIFKLRSVYPNILKLEYSNNRTLLFNNNDDELDVRDKSPIELFKNFYFKQNNIELDKKGINLVNDVIKEVSDETFEFED